MKKVDKKELLLEGVKYTKKLGKFPTRRDLDRTFKWSSDTVYRQYASLQDFYKALIKQDKSLESFKTNTVKEVADVEKVAIYKTLGVNLKDE